VTALATNRENSGNGAYFPYAQETPYPSGNEVGVFSQADIRIHNQRKKATWEIPCLHTASIRSDQTMAYVVVCRGLGISSQPSWQSCRNTGIGSTSGDESEAGGGIGLNSNWSTTFTTFWSRRHPYVLTPSSGDAARSVSESTFTRGRSCAEDHAWRRRLRTAHPGTETRFESLSGNLGRA
jgi:hypothetical protein